MKTLILAEPGRFERADTDEPAAPGDGEVLLRIHRVGICGTDLHAFRGRQPFFEYPRILGHELGAEVLTAGAGVEHVAAGDRVAVEPYLDCGSCLPCRRGRPNCCESLRVLGVHTDGGMREQIVVPARKVHASSSLSLEQLALVETLGIGAHAVERATLQTDETVLVVGAGPIGLATTQFAAIAGARVHVLEPNAMRRDFAAGAFEVAGCHDVPASAEALWQAMGDAPTCVFDATGNRAAMEAAFDWPAPSGRLVLVGFQLEPVSFANPDFHRRELTLLASRNSTAAEFRRILQLMESGQVDTTPWITHRAGYDDVVESFPTWLEPQTGVVKAMLELT